MIAKSISHFPPLGVSAGSWGSPQSLNHFSLVVGGQLHAFGEGLSIFWELSTALCCDGPWEGAVLVTRVLAGEGEQQLLPEQLLWKNVHSLRELNSSQRSTTHPQGNHLDQVHSYSIHMLPLFFLNFFSIKTVELSTQNLKMQRWRLPGQLLCTEWGNDLVKQTLSDRVIKDWIKIPLYQEGDWIKVDQATFSLAFPKF